MAIYNKNPSLLQIFQKLLENYLLLTAITNAVIIIKT